MACPTFFCLVSGFAVQGEEDEEEGGERRVVVFTAPAQFVQGHKQLPRLLLGAVVDDGRKFLQADGLGRHGYAAIWRRWRIAALTRAWNSSVFSWRMP